MTLLALFVVVSLAVGGADAACGSGPPSSAAEALGIGLRGAAEVPAYDGREHAWVPGPLRIELPVASPARATLDLPAPCVALAVEGAGPARTGRFGAVDDAGGLGLLGGRALAGGSATAIPGATLTVTLAGRRVSTPVVGVEVRVEAGGVTTWELTLPAAPGALLGLPRTIVLGRDTGTDASELARLGVLGARWQEVPAASRVDLARLWAASPQSVPLDALRSLADARLTDAERRALGPLVPGRGVASAAGAHVYAPGHGARLLADGREVAGTPVDALPGILTGGVPRRGEDPPPRAGPALDAVYRRRRARGRLVPAHRRRHPAAAARLGRTGRRPPRAAPAARRRRGLHRHLGRGRPHAGVGSSAVRGVRSGGGGRPGAARPPDAPGGPAPWLGSGVVIRPVRRYPGPMLVFSLLAACASVERVAREDAPSTDPGVPPELDTADPGLPGGEVGTIVTDGAAVLDTWPTVNYRGVDAAWNLATASALVVYGNAPIGGAVIDLGGGQLGRGFLVTDADYDGTNWTQNPRVVAVDDGWVVSWHAEGGEGPVPTARHVGWDGAGPTFSGPSVALGPAGAFQESPVALAWDMDQRRILAGWAADGLHARLLDADGAPVGEPVRLTEAGTWVEQPAVAVLRGCGCAFLTWMEATDDDAARVRAARVSTSTGTLLGEPTDLSGPVAFAKVTDVEEDALAGEVVAGWFEIDGDYARFGAARLGMDGAVVAEVDPVFAPNASYDGFDLAYSAVTGTTLGVFHGAGAAAGAGELGRDLDEGDGIELDGAGATNGMFLPRAAAHPIEPGWLVVASRDYAAVIAQRVRRE